METRIGSSENHLEGRVSAFSAFAKQLLVLQMIRIHHGRSLEHFSKERAKVKVWLLCSVVGTMADDSIPQEGFSKSADPSCRMLHIEPAIFDSVQSGDPSKRRLNPEILDKTTVVWQPATHRPLDFAEVQSMRSYG